MEIMARATAVFFFVWVVTRSIGKRQLSELTAFQLVLLITIGDLVQQGLTQDDRSVTGAFLAVGTVAAWVTIFSIISYRWPRSQRGIVGLPGIVVSCGPVTDLRRAAPGRPRLLARGRRALVGGAPRRREDGVARPEDVLLGKGRAGQRPGPAYRRLRLDHLPRPARSPPLPQAGEFGIHAAAHRR